MKKIVLLVVIIAFFISCQKQETTYSMVKNNKVTKSHTNLKENNNYINDKRIGGVKVYYGLWNGDIEGASSGLGIGCLVDYAAICFIEITASTSVSKTDPPGIYVNHNNKTYYIKDAMVVAEEKNKNITYYQIDKPVNSGEWLGVSFDLILKSK